MHFSSAYSPLRALSSGWSMFTRAPLALLVGGVILFVTGGDFNGGVGARIRDEGHLRDELWAVLSCFGCCFAVLYLLVNTWITIGFAHAVEECARTGATRMETVFDPKQRIVKLFLARLLKGLLMLAAALPFVLIGFGAAGSIELLELPDELVAVGTTFFALAYLCVFAFIALGLTFVDAIVALEGLDAVAAIKRSWELSHGHRLRLLWYFFVLKVFTALGLCACFVGVFATYTLAHAAQIESFLAFTRPDEYQRMWLAGIAGRTSA
jgi:hypothetical protein